jgi:Metallo-peptidase family M12/S-layer homology domain
MNHVYRTIAGIVAATLAVLTSATAIAQAPALLRVLGASPDTKIDAKLGDTATVKSRIVRPDLAALDEIARHHVATQHKSRFVIDLFPGLDLEAEVLAVETRRDGVTLFARLTEIELGSAVFTIDSGVLTATVDFPGGSFLVTPQMHGHHQVAQKAAQLFPPELQPRLPFQPKRTVNPFDRDVTVKVAPADSGRLIDIVVVWTPAAETAAGGLALMQNLAQASVDSANSAYLNSGIAQRLRLVHRQQVTYTERTNCAGGDQLDCALDDVTDVGDGYLDNVHTLRDTHGADLVALLIDGSAFCGIAWLPSTPSPNLGFSVTEQSCAIGNKSFAHEVGHNMGAHHDPYVLSGGPCGDGRESGDDCFSRGMVNLAQRWRTIMSYNNQCTATDPFTSCTRIAYFSNPKLTSGGAPLGDAPYRNNAHTLNKTAKAIAGYRATSALHPVAQRFTDVPSNHAFYGYIEFFAQAEISTGCGGGLFCPDAHVSRRAMAAFLERAMRASNWTPTTNSTVFTDVVAGSSFAGHIEAMRTDGITSGCTSTTYCPESSVTRAQMAVFLLRSRCGAGYVPNTPAAPTFSDVPLSHPFVAYIDKLYSLGITGGCASGPLRYCPDLPVTRGQMATFVERAYPFLTPSEACSS